PFLQDIVEGLPAGTVADKAVVILQFQVVAVDLGRRQHLCAMWAKDGCNGSISHEGEPPVRRNNARGGRNVSRLQQLGDKPAVVGPIQCCGRLFLTVKSLLAITPARAGSTSGQARSFCVLPLTRPKHPKSTD